MKISRKKIEDFIIFNQHQIKQILSESSSITSIGNKNITDDGPAWAYRNMTHYMGVSKEQANKLGMEIVNIIMPEMKFEDYNTDYPNGPIEGSSYFVKQPAKFSDKNGNDENTVAVEIKTQDSYKKWKKHIDKIITNLGWEYVDTTQEQETKEDLTKEFMNEVFSLTNDKFYITVKNNKTKIARHTAETKNPKNIINILTENTSDVVYSNLISIKSKLNNFKHINKILDNGNTFLMFETKEHQLQLTNVIDKNGNIRNKQYHKLIKHFNEN